MPNTRKESSATHHYVNKALGPINFPTDKATISKIAGSSVVPVGKDGSETIENLLAKIEVDRFSCAAAFFCALSASMLKK